MITPLERLNISSNYLNQGLNLTAKIFLNSKEWSGQFTKIQTRHETQIQQKQKQFQKKLAKKRQRFSISIVNKFQKKHTQKCNLCMIEKPIQQFRRMCQCEHTFCFSCLNIYSIARIQQMQCVKCPQLQCTQQMTHTSQIYKFLPDKIKLQLIQNKHKRQIKRITLTGLCLKCMRPPHSGPCKIKFHSDFIQQAWKFRQCKKCSNEIKFNQGKNKITCNQCNYSFCYLCGNEWPQSYSYHKCVKTTKLIRMQNLNRLCFEEGCVMQCCGSTLECCYKGQLKTYGCCCCDYFNEDCCPGLQCKTCEKFDQCTLSLFECNKCNIPVIFGNFLLIPWRIIVTLFMSIYYLILLVPISLLFLLYIIGALFVGMSCTTFQILSQQSGYKLAISVIFCPITMFVGVSKALKQFSKIYSGMLNSFFNMIGDSMCSIWTYFGPKQCCP